MDGFNPETAAIGGMTVISVQLVLMAQIRSFFPGRIRGWSVSTKIFDLINYLVSAVLLLLVIPPWPVYSYEAWRNYIGASLATAALASITAKKVMDEKGGTTEPEPEPPRVKPLIPRKDS